MSDFKEFLMENFDEVEVIEKVVRIGGKDKTMQFKPINAAKGDEIRKKCRKTSFLKGQKITETDNDKFMANQIIETTVHPDFKNADLQSAWGVMGAEELVKAMKSRMSDGEYMEWSTIVSEINGYDKGMQELIEESKN